jgi:predicted metal-dependent hydrolase
MSSKSPRITALLESHRGRELDAHYLGFFECFNRQLYFEAHEVLEELWLEDRFGPNGAFYKGLIQLAGAFVHLQKDRPGPAAALFRLAEANLGKYGGVHERFDLGEALSLIRDWLKQLQTPDASVSQWIIQHIPCLELEPLEEKQERIRRLSDA